MRTTVSEVNRSNETLHAFMREQCALAAEFGGTFAVRDLYKPTASWFTEYTINWPEPLVITKEAA